jgi:uncharacterized protein YukE
MKFAMGASTLGGLTKNTKASSDDLGALVKQLFAAAEPLEGSFRGAGRAAFDTFKGETDRIANELNGALAAVLTGISGQDRSFTEGESQMIDETKAAQSGSAFDAARFSSAKA